eukprot:TRINITY_DN2655_c0_g1_i6.p1 TRINITY_DN2655_c0_g1~~TRINITY_DN2655_c0_g1_i6.p1  ORF type:complete len:101 (-),score=19.63 TRINITY_DN2655_c0_g1_i6:60-362(-)
MTEEDEKKMESEYYQCPKTGEPKADTVFPGLTGVNEQIAILSFLDYKDLVKIAKVNRFAFQFVMEETARKRIQHWKPSKEEETRINNYILSLIQAIDIKD